MGINLTIRDKFNALNQDDPNAVDKLFTEVFRNILNNPKMGLIGTVAKNIPIKLKYYILTQYVANNSQGSLRLTPNGDSVQFVPKENLGASGFAKGRSRLG